MSASCCLVPIVSSARTLNGWFGHWQLLVLKHRLHCFDVSMEQHYEQEDCKIKVRKENLMHFLQSLSRWWESDWCECIQVIVYFPRQSFYIPLFREQDGFIWSLSFSCGWVIHMYFYAETLVLISNFPLIHSFSLSSSLNVPANDCVQSCAYPVLQVLAFFYLLKGWNQFQAGN